MWEKQNSTVDVLFSFNGREQYARPVQLQWQDETYDLAGVQFWYVEHKGGALVHHYTVSDRGGNYTFQLALETENLTWKLEKAAPIAGGRLNMWPSRGLVGAV